jgi:plastocyanin
MREAWAWGAVVVLLAAGSAGAGTVTGQIAVLEKDGRPAKDASEAVVWIEGTPARPKPTPATVNMKSKAFVPRVTVVTVGSAVSFPNQDSIFHNVFSVSAPNNFDLQLYKKPKSASKTFTAPGLVRIYCNIHPQMSGFVLVLDSPFWVQVAADGSFSIPDVPAGSWTLKAWHARAGEVAEPVRVPESGTVKASLSLDASQWKRAPHKNKYGKDYPAGERY